MLWSILTILCGALDTGRTLITIDKLPEYSLRSIGSYRRYSCLTDTITPGTGLALLQSSGVTMSTVLLLLSVNSLLLFKTPSVDNFLLRLKNLWCSLLFIS
jgi:hypothetical protein